LQNQSIILKTHNRQCSYKCEPNSQQSSNTKYLLLNMAIAAMHY
jgi:hypothetical protein